MLSNGNPPESAKTPGLFGRTLLFLDGSRRFKALISITVFIIGLLIWISIQGSLAVVPLWTRALPPETDDSLAYILKSRQMEDCFNQDCPALRDLRSQLLYGKDRDAPSYKEFKLAASRIFPVYHPLLSLVIVGLKNLGLGWMNAYKAIWTIGPILFCIAFAYLLVKLFGLSAAGLALGLLAFKVFPDTGLHCVVPSNLTMGMAVIIWARIISKRGNALITLIVGSVLMVSTHPVGIIYSLMSIVIALSLSEKRFRPKTWLPLVIVLLIAGVAFFISDIVKGPFFTDYHFLPHDKNPLKEMLIGAGENMVEFIVGILRLEPGLLGTPAIFFGAILLGILTLSFDKKSVLNRIILIYSLSIFVLMFYVASHPADVIFRMWIPFVVILFGSVGQAIWYCLKKSWDLLIRNINNPEYKRAFDFSKKWPAVALAILLGYSVQMAVNGMEQVYSMGIHMKARQPLRFELSQVDKLLSLAGPEDRVLYTSMIIMPFYFIHGAMDLGAVYYHPSMRYSPEDEKWLNRPDLRFAVSYNPTVYHPSFRGLKENDWWVQNPEFHFSPLNKRRKNSPISHEGFVPADRFKWLDIAINDKTFQESLRIKINNPGKKSSIILKSVGKGLKHDKKGMIKKDIAKEWEGWIEFDLTELQPSKRYRLVFPSGEPSFTIGGAVFGDDQLNWPWAQKADIYFMFKDADTGLVKISFNPSKGLPFPLNRKEITVLDDQGSSVLYRITQTDS